MTTPDEPSTPAPEVAPAAVTESVTSAPVVNPVPAAEPRRRWGAGLIALVSGGAVLALLLAFGGGVLVGHVTADHGRQFPGIGQGGFRPGDGNGPGMGAPGQGGRDDQGQNGGHHDGGQDKNGQDKNDQSDDSDN